ncbi:putative villin/Gelsolin, ADF-H/Gelsolin-like domain superfamily [Helianthus annuus]|nr:putative villin/Gelsolin, ADF-H/Gelsolin-like domain superfamily [Helianthus annuus]
MLNHDDVFVLDTKDKIFQLQFNGANSNIQERAKALEVIQFLKDKYHERTCNVAIVDDGKLQAEGDSGEFWVIFGGFAPIGKKVLSDDDVIPKRTHGKLYRNESCMLLIIGCSLEAFISLKIGETYACRGEHTQ